MPDITKDPWSRLRAFTPARIALGRAGASLPTREVLALSLAHARARDAVHAPFDAERIARDIAALGLEAILLGSDATDRAVYLRRPDYGRRLSAASRALLDCRGIPPVPADLALVIGDGLSATAVHRHAVPLLEAFLPHAARLGLRLAPAAVVRGARVAIGDEIGAALGARAVAVLIGERPGLSSPDSLGIYLTYAPAVGRTDAERNCISNVRAEGLACASAAFKLAWLVSEALRRGLTGVALKDESDRALEGGHPPAIAHG